MLGGAVGEGSPGGEELLTVTVLRDEHGYGMKVSGDNPVYVQSVKEHGAAWRAGLRAGDRILKVDSVPVHHHTHQQVVHMIRANPSTVLTVQQNTSRHKTPITAPVPVNQEKLRQLEVSKVHTMRLMLEKEQKYMRDLRNELLKVPDVRKQTQLDAAEQRCALLQHEIDNITAGQPEPVTPTTPTTPKLSRKDPEKNANMGFLSGLPRSLSNLTGQSLRNLRQARQKQEAPLVRQNSDETHNIKQMLASKTNRVPTTCLDNTPPPLPPRSTERPKRNTMSPISPVNCNSQVKYKKPNPMHQSMPEDKFLRSSHSLDIEEGPQPNSIALQMSYPLVNVPPPPLQTDNRGAVPILHVRSQSSPEHLDHDLPRTSASGVLPSDKEWRGTPPPGTPPPPYLTSPHMHVQSANQHVQPCIDSQRAIISMEEDDPPSDSSTNSGLFSNLRSVRESKARMAVLINWLLGERRCACASLVLVLTDAFRAAAGAPPHTLRRWAYEIQSTFLMPDAILHLNGVDENMANEIEQVLINENSSEDVVRNVFRKARRLAKDELARALADFQVKRQVGLSALYAPDDAVLLRCRHDRDQERTVVERLMCQRLSALASAGAGAGAACAANAANAASPDAHATLLAALTAAALCLDCRPASVAAAVGGSRGSFLQRDKLYKQRLKQLGKQHPQPFVVRGHVLQPAALTSVAHCHHCALVLGGLAPQAYVCAHCRLRLHRACARRVDEPCCMRDDGAAGSEAAAGHNRISRFMERMHAHAPLTHNAGQDSNDKKSRKTSGTAQFLNLERSFRKVEDEPPWDVTLTPTVLGESRREGSTEDQSAPDVDVDASDNTLKEPEKEQSWKSGARGVNRAESCRERDAPRRGKHRNASDPNRLTAHPNHDLEGTPTAPSGSSSSSSLSSRSNESNTVAAEQQGSQSDWSEEEDPLAAQWSDSLPQYIRDTIVLSARIRKRQEVIHELIVSEGSHVRWLKVLGVDFLKPLERQPSLLPPEELRALFPNLPGVRERHTKLYTELRLVRNEAINHVVEIRPVADAMLNTLGESGYASCLSKFCSGQRMALDSLRERRRKNKELHQFLAGREQLPRCGRLQLRDLLACVWQRLTKYQLLLESILKTTSTEGSDADASEDIEQLKKALSVAKDVLHSVDTAIRTQENYHRLCTIQEKIEVRTLPEKCGSDFEELRKLDLTAHTLRLEGELALRTDTKKIRVLALMLEDSLVLLQREGEKFILRPLPQTGHNSYITPIIKWDKVLFRPNAAVRNTFFLMNINSIQMHELSANTAAEYANWVKHIQEARLAEARPVAAHAHARSADDTNTVNVSRNPSDASEKSTSSAPADTCERERDRDRGSNERERDGDRTSNERERDGNRTSNERERDGERLSNEREENEKEKEAEKEKEDSEDERNKLASPAGSELPAARKPAVGRISTHACGAAPAQARAVCVRADPVHTALTVLSHHERLRRLDSTISRALRAKSEVVAELLGVPPHAYAHVAELASADVMGQVDICGELNTSRESEAPDLHQLLLAAQAQANQLTEALSAAMSVSAAGAVAARAGRCDACRRRAHTDEQENIDKSSDISQNESRVDTSMGLGDVSSTVGESDTSFDLLPDFTQNGASDCIETHPSELAELSSASAAQLAARLSPHAATLQRALACMLSTLPHQHARQHALRAQRVLERERADCVMYRHGDDYQMTEEIFPKGVDQSIQDQPSNGG